MKRYFAHLSLLAALAATLLTAPSAEAAGRVPTKLSGHSSHVRALVPKLPQQLTTGSRHRLFGSGQLATTIGTSLTPRVTQVTSLNRTVAPGVAAVTAPAPYPTPAPTPTPSSDIYHISQQQVLINQDRAGNGGLAPLAWSPCLANIAQQNAQRIAAQGYLSHTNGPTLDLACDPTYTYAGENIAYISSGINDTEANTMFMNSAPHRANILNGTYRFVATAWVVAPNGYAYIAVEFAG